MSVKRQLWITCLLYRCEICSLLGCAMAIQLLPCGLPLACWYYTLRHDVAPKHEYISPRRRPCCVDTADIIYPLRMLGASRP
ncbi:unnamed protein product [Nezara viridula]|uniref:Uncharacterized protein n=1 Tax=Nezara viridula TaxID=85310 RepID=A0A9P0H4U5_NEZVI|nr:unnamed protein product [Nezara viridula]